MSDVVARVAATVRDEIRATSAYSTHKPSGMIELHANENPWPLPASLRGEIAATVAEAAVNRYPEGAGERVKQSLARAMPIPAGAAIAAVTIWISSSEPLPSTIAAPAGMGIARASDCLTRSPAPSG